MTIFIRTLGIAAILAAGLTAAQAQTPGGPNPPPVPPHAGASGSPAQAQPAVGQTNARPSQVPSDYVPTPNGWFHPSCVVHLGEGDELQPSNQRIKHPNGTTSIMPKCGYPHFRANGARVNGDEHGVTDPNINGWVEDVAATTTTAYGYIYAEWSVPPTPTSSDGQTIYYFP